MSAFLPGCRRSSGGSFTPDGTYPTYTSMAALAAAVTATSRIAELIGGTTGARVALVERVSAGANGLVWRGDLNLYQADGTEFDGVFAPVLLGSGSIAWGTAGSTSTGGVSISGGSGTIKFPGWRYIDGQRRIIYAQAYIDSFPANNVGDCMLVGVVPSAATVTDLYCGGVANNGSGVRAAGSVNSNPTTPGLGYGSALGGAPTGGQLFELFMTACRSSNAADSANVSGCFHPFSSTGGYAGTEYNLTNTASLDGSSQTFVPCVTQVNISGRFTKIGNLSRGV